MSLNEKEEEIIRLLINAIEQTNHAVNALVHNTGPTVLNPDDGARRIYRYVNQSGNYLDKARTYMRTK